MTVETRYIIGENSPERRNPDNYAMQADMDHIKTCIGKIERRLDSVEEKINGRINMIEVHTASKFELIEQKTTAMFEKIIAEVNSIKNEMSEYKSTLDRGVWKVITGTISGITVLFAAFAKAKGWL